MSKETIINNLKSEYNIEINESKIEEYFELNKDFYKVVIQLINYLNDIGNYICANEKIYSKIYIDVANFTGAKQIYIYVLLNRYYKNIEYAINRLYYNIEKINPNYTVNMQVQLIYNRDNLCMLYKNIEDLINLLKNIYKVEIDDEDDLISYCIEHIDAPFILLKAIILVRKEYPDDKLYVYADLTSDMSDYDAIVIKKEPKFELSIAKKDTKDNKLSEQIEEMQECTDCNIMLWNW